MNLIENVTTDKSVTITSAAFNSFVPNGITIIQANSGKEIRINSGEGLQFSFLKWSGTDANPL